MRLMFWKKSIDKPSEPVFKEGDILVDKDFGGVWGQIQIVKIGIDGDRFLYKYLVAKGKLATSGDLYDNSLSYFKTIFRKQDN